MSEPAPSPSAAESSAAPAERAARPETWPRPRAFRQERLTVELPGRAVEIVDRLVVAKGQPSEELLTRAIILYDAAVRAEAEGKRIAVLDADGEIEQEIINP